MDNITHSLVGAVLAQTGLKRKTRKGAAALILGANAPDIDVFLGWVPWLPLATHRGFTHGYLAVIFIMPALVAGFLWLIDRWQAKRGKAFDRSLDMRWMWALSLIGVATHPFLDWQTTYAVQLNSPFSTRWYHVDTLFIIDLWLWIALGGAWFISRRLEKAGRNFGKPAIICLVGALAYIGANGLITYRAEAAMATITGQVRHIATSPPPLLFWKRDIVALGNDVYRWARFDPLGHPALKQTGKTERTGMADPAVGRAIAQHPRLQQFMRWSIMPIAKVQRENCVATVTVSDARYQQALTRGNFQHVVRVPEPCPKP